MSSSCAVAKYHVEHGGGGGVGHVWIGIRVYEDVELPNNNIEALESSTQQQHNKWINTSAKIKRTYSSTRADLQRRSMVENLCVGVSAVLFTKQLLMHVGENKVCPSFVQTHAHV
jgi:hypothetical protein